MLNTSGQSGNTGNTQATVNQPTAPGAGLNQSPVQATPLGAVLGFVTEFNANTQIFNIAAAMLLVALAQMKEIKDIAVKHTQELGVHTLAIAAIRSDVAGLKREMGDLAGRVNSSPPVRPAKHNKQNYQATQD